jgi:copper(I)-binding protein
MVLRPMLLPLLVFPGLAFAELEISNPWIKNLPPSVPVRAGYMTLHNPQSKTVSIVSLSSDAFGSIEIHQTIAQDGMMRMEQVPALKIEPDSTVQLAPGGLHLMMMNPIEPTRIGDTIEILILFDDGSEQKLEMRVKK